MRASAVSASPRFLVARKGKKAASQDMARRGGEERGAHSAEGATITIAIATAIAAAAVAPISIVFAVVSLPSPPSPAALVLPSFSSPSTCSSSSGAANYREERAPPTPREIEGKPSITLIVVRKPRHWLLCDEERESKKGREQACWRAGGENDHHRQRE